jgi:superfamily II DNA/RNA helicase
VLAAATLPNYGLKSADERVKQMFPGAVQVENELLHRAQPQLVQDWVERHDADALPQLAKLLLDDAADAAASSGASGSSSARVRRTMVFCNTAAGAASCARGLADALEAAGLDGGGRSALVLPYHKEVEKELTMKHAFKTRNAYTQKLFSNFLLGPNPARGRVCALNPL